MCPQHGGPNGKRTDPTVIGMEQGQGVAGGVSRFHAHVLSQYLQVHRRLVFCVVFLTLTPSELLHPLPILRDSAVLRCPPLPTIGFRTPPVHTCLSVALSTRVRSIGCLSVAQLPTQYVCRLTISHCAGVRCFSAEVVTIFMLKFESR